MSSVTLELAGSTTRTAVELPDDVPIEHLMHSMVTLVGDGCPAEGRWRAYLPGGERLDAGVTFREAEIPDRATIYITRTTLAIDPELPHPTAPSDDSTPSERSARIVPAPLTTRARLRESARALVGTRATPDALDATALERVAAMWRWTDHRHRLEWIVARPRLHRTVTIGVVSLADTGTAALTATRIAAAFAEARTDRVFLVDGDPVRAGVTRLAGGSSATTVAAVAAGHGGLDPRFGSSDHGPTVISNDLASTDVPGFDVYRRMLDRVRPSAGVVVVDCGPFGASRLADLCEQVVLVTDRPVDDRTARTFSHRPTVLAVSDRGRPDRGVERTVPTAMGSVCLDREHSGHELAAVLADGWGRLGATS